ncbi:MAG: Gfo/Idh/MocA family oxidoreductase [Verrucomicrobia bacterium]|nr:Gfo/Idh/MocA family oxidoreductase [Verrucomicrobiota bacterium]
MKNTSPQAGDSRRSFLKKTTTTAAAVTGAGLLRQSIYGQSQAPSFNVKGANDKIVVGLVGIGHGIGKAHRDSIKKNAAANNVQIGAVCELWSKRREESAKICELGEKDSYVDHRKMLEQKDIDCVVVATHDVWHAPVSIDVMNSGKHVYCEKPMTRYLDEALAVYDTAKKTKAVFQVGSQGCSAQTYHKAAELIKAGKIGTPVWGQGSYCRNNPAGEWNYDIELQNAGEIDWKHWLGKSGDRAFSPDHYHRWRKYLPYCAGLLGDLFPHRLHPLLLMTGNPEFPRRVVCTGTKKISTDRDVNDTTQMICEFPSGYTIFIVSTTVNSLGLDDVVRGNKAIVRTTVGANKVELVPERPYSEEIDQQLFDGLSPGEAIGHHEKNWFDCIRSGKTPNAGIDLAIRVQTIISMAEISERHGIAAYWDDKRRRVTDSSGKEFRIGYDTPTTPSLAKV